MTYLATHTQTSLFFAPFPERSWHSIMSISCDRRCPGTRVHLICVAQRTIGHKVLACKSENPVKSRVSNERREAEFISKLPAFGHWLSARLPYFQCFCYWDTHLGPYDTYDLLNLGSCNGLMSEGNWSPSRLCAFAGYSWVIINDALWHLTWFHWKCKI